MVHHKSFFLVGAVCVILLIMSCGGPGTQTHSSNVKFDQYFVHGEQLFQTNCSNCHQKSGTGLGRVYPPLNKSDFMDNNLDKVLCLMKYGIDGEIVVNGNKYNQAMQSPGLTDLEIAEIATYIYNSWGREKGIIEVIDVSKIVAKCDSTFTK